MDVHPENQKGASQLLKFFDAVRVALAGGDDLINPAGKWMGAGGGDLQSNALSRGYELAARAVHFDAQLADVFADLRAGLDDGLVHLVLYLLDNVRGGRGDELHDVRAQRAGCGIDNLEFFFDNYGEAVSHGVALRTAVV